MPSFNWRLALQSGYTPEEIQAHLDKRGLSDEALIERQLGGKPMLPYTYAPDLDAPPPAAAPPPLMSGPPASIPGSVPQTGERRNLSPQEIGALWDEQGIQPELLPPLSLGDLAMQPVGELLNDADVAKYLLPLGLLGMVKTRQPRATDLFHGTSSRNLRSMSEEGIAPYSKAYVSPFPEIAKDVAHERVYGLNPSGDVLEGGIAAGGQPTLVVLDRKKLKDAGVKLERDPEMNWNRANWRDVGGLMTTLDSATIPSDAIKRAYVGEKQIRKAVAEYGPLKKRMAKKTGR